MMHLNDNLISCIESAAASVWLCNTNEQLETDMVRVLGVQVDADRRHLTVYIPESYGADVIRNLSVTDKITFLTAIIFTYESYQVKGTYISHRASTEEEIKYQKAYMDDFAKALQKQGLSREKAYKAYFRQPCIALRMVAEEVYEQTPRKGTGERLAV
ncbi:hypothetical protein GXP67_19335 [Rhodocytophaga rosea]|uniref:Uncharacterized protein n=1 Tax=Rhodocytophaga rosea TaxID=2704465 RepID=A0A6C0GLX6_9BACT|nr:hypothetical protein [Rhodocytophaga rosea]QHT68643.1 hypothetical protein GXP67_19335 [Rhodocytophaga rosea]